VALDVADEPDAAGIVFVLRIVQALSGRIASHSGITGFNGQRGTIQNRLYSELACRSQTYSERSVDKTLSSNVTTVNPGGLELSPYPNQIQSSPI
jgi:hypothetical protein